MSLIARLENRFGHWAVPGLCTYIAAATAFTYVLWKVQPGLIAALAMSPLHILAGEFWRLFTYIFVPHIGSILPMPEWANAAIYIIFLIWVGRGLDHAWGAFRTNLYCLAGWVSITIASFAFGALYAQFLWVESLFFAYARFYGDQQIYLFYVLPVKVRWAAWGLAVWTVLQAFMEGPMYQASVIAVVLNYFLFFGRDIIADARMRREVGARRAEFGRRMREATADALHRCHLCGRTDESDPEIEFRVAADGEEYCTDHLPKRPSEA